MSIDSRIDAPNPPVCCRQDCCNEAHLYKIKTDITKQLSFTQLGILWNTIEGQRHCQQGTTYFFSLFGTDNGRIGAIFREALDQAVQDHNLPRVEELIHHNAFATADITILEEAYSVAEQEGCEDIMDALASSNRGEAIIDAFNLHHQQDEEPEDLFFEELNIGQNDFQYRHGG